MPAKIRVKILTTGEIVMEMDEQLLSLDAHNALHQRLATDLGCLIEPDPLVETIVPQPPPQLHPQPSLPEPQPTPDRIRQT